MDKILISACLLGQLCRYDGKSNYLPIVEKLKTKYELVPICPEVFGYLDVPRDPNEIKDGKVITLKGKDVTKNFKMGAKESYHMAKIRNCKIAILKDGSPSCGSTYIYDGTFTHTKIEGKGLTTLLLEKKGIKVYTEKDIEKLL